MKNSIKNYFAVNVKAIIVLCITCATVFGQSVNYNPDSISDQKVNASGFTKPDNPRPPTE
jgi:hypothetical protein